MTLLSQFSPEDINAFHSDFKVLLEAAFEIDKEVSAVDSDTSKNIPLFKEMVSLFKKKYPMLHVEVDIRHMRCRPNLFIACTSLQELFTQVIMQIDGLRSVGDPIAEQRTVENKQLMLEEAARVHQHMEVFFVGYNNNLILLKFSPKNRGAQLVYDKDTLLDQNSPDFQLVCYTALHQGFRREIKLHGEQFRFETDVTLSICEPR
ncbi:MAG: hypothetical protein V1735_00755 [Nanoarchaeota archaeon]